MIQPNWDLIQTENPTLSIKNVDKIGEGWSCLGYLVNESQVFKIPKIDCWDELTVEILFLEALGPQLPLPVPLPISHRRESAAAPFGYAAYSYIPGQELSLNLLSIAERQTAINDMADFLQVLHGLQPEAALREILYVEDHTELAKTARRLLKAAETEIAPHLSKGEADNLRRTFAQHTEQYTQPFTPCLLHRDFCTDNMRMDNGTITGVIDFGNMVLGDPDIEFAEVYHEHGEATLLETAKRYGHPDPSHLAQKMALLSIVNSVEVIIDDAEYAPEGVVDQCWSSLHRILA